MHSYTTPAILVIPIESIDKGYLAWLMAETEPAAAAGGGLTSCRRAAVQLTAPADERTRRNIARAVRRHQSVSRRPQQHAFRSFSKTAALTSVDMFLHASLPSTSTVPFGDQ